jgi:hypothetical protein
MFQRVDIATGEGILPIKDIILEELNKRVQYHDRESQVHKRLADIIGQLPEEQEEEEEPEVVVVEALRQDNEQSVISVNSSTTASFDTQLQYNNNHNHNHNNKQVIILAAPDRYWQRQ